ncbi:hypothetical protein HMPREF3291_02605 [Bacillus sp. HMSC76G11]|nr:hypothetical protein HMPREF3291_02605 [Bacillus sp. HMSC76G11]
MINDVVRSFPVQELAFRDPAGSLLGACLWGIPFCSISRRSQVPSAAIHLSLKESSLIATIFTKRALIINIVSDLAGDVLGFRVCCEDKKTE